MVAEEEAAGVDAIMRNNLMNRSMEVTEMKNRRAFTLIELLVVVAIIAILAGIALPNLLEAQTRSKVSRVKADLRTLATALEAYAVDHNKYPPSTLVPRFRRFRPLTTPVAYISTIPQDIFDSNDSSSPRRPSGNFAYGAMPIDEESRWAMTSDGPDRNPNNGNIQFYPGYSQTIWENPSSGFDFVRYDPTNGTISRGDIWRVSDYNFE